MEGRKCWAAEPESMEVPKSQLGALRSSVAVEAQMKEDRADLIREVLSSARPVGLCLSLCLDLYLSLCLDRCWTNPM